MALKERVKRLEDKANPAEEIKITVTKGEGGCPSAAERAANPELNKIIFICDCPNCNPQRFKGKLNEKNKKT